MRTGVHSALAGVLAAVVAIGGAGLLIGELPTAAGQAPRTGAEMAANTSLVPHSALYVNASAPSAPMAPGEEFAAIFEVMVPAYTSGIAGDQVVIPPAYVQIPTTTGALHLYLNAVNFTVAGSAAESAPAGPPTRFGTALAFNASTVAALSSQQVAVTATWPYGGPSVEFRWTWTATAQDGSTAQGNYSAWTSVTPGQLASPTQAVAHTWVIGSPYELCLGGPIGGRTFSLHLATSSPVEQIDGGAVSVPVGPHAQFCWNSTFAVSVTPQQAFVHLWEYGNVTFLLLTVLIQITNDPAPPAGGGGSSPPLSSLATAALFGVGIVVVVVVVEILLVAGRARRRRAPTAGTTGAPPGAVADVGMSAETRGGPESAPMSAGGRESPTDLRG